MRFFSYFCHFWILLLCWLVCAFFPVQAETFKTTLAEANLTVQLKGQSDVVDLGVRTLPWKWDAEFPRQAGIGRFTFKLNLTHENYTALQADGKGIAFSALSIGNRYRFRLNSGNWQSVGWDEATTQYRSKPRWHVLPLAQLKPSENTLELELRLEPANSAGLSKLDVGDLDLTFVEYQNLINLHYSSSLLIMVISLVIGFLTLIIWFISKQKIFLLSSVAEIVFALRQFSFFIEYPPISTWLWNAFTASILSVYIYLMCEISRQLLKRKTSILTLSMRYFTCFSIIIIFIESARGGTFLFLFWLFTMFVFAALHMGRLLWFAWHIVDLNIRIFALAFVVSVVFGLYDYFFIHYGSAGFGHIRMSMFIPLMFNLSLALIVTRHFMIIQNESVRAKLNVGIEQEQVRYRERQRIMTELHDSVGSHLVGLLSLIKGGAARKDIESLTTDALQELRIAVDAIQPVNGNLAAVLATLRHRLQPRLDAMNLKLIWEVDDLPKLQTLTPQGIQNIQRILLEAFTNIMHHASASSITVKASHFFDQRLIKISVCDDGKGFDMGKSYSQGQGIKNMRSRAEALGASISFQQRQPNGTCINLSISYE
jgi:signal transduction histidine kinase